MCKPSTCPLFRSFMLALICLISFQLVAQPLDPTFDPGAGANGVVNSVALLPDGKVLIGGGFTEYNGTARNRIARLNADGTLDTSFDPGAGANGVIHSVVVQSDNKILIGGDFNFYDGTRRSGIARLEANGGLDTGFSPSPGTNNSVRSVAVQPDGKVLIGGNFTTYNGTARNRIARINTDGTLDASFDPGTGANGFVYAMELQSDGQILIGGAFTDYNGTIRNRLALLNADGSLDTSFDPGAGPSADVFTLASQPDGKILIGGNFTTYNGTARSRIARLEATGTLDTSFDPGAGANGFVFSIAQQPDGKIVIGGFFLRYDNVVRNRIARLNADGSLDTEFAPSSGANNTVRSVVLQPNGRILIGGNFTEYNGTGRNRIARIAITPKLTFGSVPPFCQGPTSFTIPYTVTEGEPDTYTLSGTGVLPGQTGSLGESGMITVNIDPDTFTGDFTLVATNSTTMVSSDPIPGSVTVNPLPTITPGPDQLVFLGFGSTCTDISATASGGTAPYTFNWSASSETDGTIEVCPEVTTTYTVTATDANGCTSEEAQITVEVQDVRCGNKLNKVEICYYGVTQCVREKIAKRYLRLGATLGACGSGSAARIGVEESTLTLLKLTLKPYPNPVRDAVTVEVLAPTAGEGTFEVLDLSGRARQSRREVLVEGRNEVVFRLGTLPSGVYLIRATDAANRQGVVRVSKE